MSDYTQALLDYRHRKDEYYRSGRGPLKDEALASFQGLAYYSPAPEWVFALPLEPTTHTGEFKLETNTGDSRFMAVIGVVQLPLPGGTTHELLVFGPLGEDSPQAGFVPFKDATSGTETYGAGRYIDAPLRDGVLYLDFNRAYHPTCAHGDGWVCPLPPAQNVLRVAIQAGERLR